MDASTRGAHEDNRSAPRGNRSDPHGWNSLENFIQVHEGRLGEHPFVDTSRPHTLRYEFFDEVFRLSGTVFCLHDVILEVTKYYGTRNSGGRVQVRGYSYRYNAHVHNGHNVLRYDNGHDDTPEEFHRHLFDRKTGAELERRIITRHELPTFSQILDELQALFDVPPQSE